MAVEPPAIRFRLVFLLLVAGALLLAAGAARGQTPSSLLPPSYTAASIVNAATQTAMALAPNTIATIYGTNLSWDTHAITAADIAGSQQLPQNLAGVTVTVDTLSTSLFYVSPTQINFLIPYELTPGPATVQVLRDGVAGPKVTVQLDNASPGFFEWNTNLAVAQHGGGTLVSPSAPASPGETIALYATGLGHTLPDTQSGMLSPIAAQISSLANLQVYLNGVPCPPSSIAYAGLTPGFAGLYQVNLQLPVWLPPNPMIQMMIGNDVSPSTVILPVQ